MADNKRVEFVTLESARWRLARIWFGFGAIVLLVLIGQSIGNVYGEDMMRVWGWALPNFVPQLALMASVFAADALKPVGRGIPRVRANFLALSTYASLFYLLVFFFTVVSPPLVLVLRGLPEERPIDLLELSNLWLTPTQGIVIGLLGVLFFLKDEDPSHPQ
ncbi:MAG: hypothetical protein INF93_16110 [Rhodobacter sp.]|nr:hypothetical protein [Rhodobacter sp.]